MASQVWSTSRCAKSPDTNWRVVTAHTIVGVQHQRWTVGIYLLPHGRNFLSRNLVAVLDGQQDEPVNTVLLQHPQKYSRGTRQYTFHTFPSSTKPLCTSLAYSQDLSKIFWSGKFFCSATTATKTAQCIIQLWFNYFRGIMTCTLPGRLSKKMPR